MKTNLYLLIVFILSTFNTIYAQDTFSICAVDSVTGQVGSAGATCIASSSVSANIISDVHPGYGVVHTQAYYYSTNQNYGRDLMNLQVRAFPISEAGRSSVLMRYTVGNRSASTVKLIWAATTRSNGPSSACMRPRNA